MRGMLFALESFRRHMDSGRWLFQLGLEAEGYQSSGGGNPPPEIDGIDVAALMAEHEPPVAIMWPRYEWDHAQWRGPPGTVKPEHTFRNLEPLIERDDVFRVAVFHDAGSVRRRQKLWHEEYRPHAWLCWYHETSVTTLAPHVPLDKIIRTWHVIDGDKLPEVEPRDRTCVVSGAHVHDVYPLRTRCIEAARQGKLGPGVDLLPHPGYHYKGTTCPDFIRTLSKYRVAVCTSSLYRFALKKHIEATAAGCIVVTDLPLYDCMPGIDGNFVRVPSGISIGELRDVIETTAAAWNLERQRAFARAAVQRYDYRAEGTRLAHELDAWRARL